MNWDYMAGLFDGEGSVTLSYSKKMKSVQLQAKISSSSPTFRKEIRAFLLSEGIQSSESTFKTKLGTTEGALVQSWGGCEKLLNKLEGKLIEKRAKVELMKRAIILHKTLRENGEPLASHLREFDSIRRELHSTSKKGRKDLVKWEGL